MSFDSFLSFTIFGLVVGSAYAIAASGLVITYATSNVFNMAHGAVGMVMAFVYWELDVNRGLPAVVALLLVVLVIAPLFGAIIERVMMRHLAGASVTVSLTVTVGLLVMLIGFAQNRWPPTGRSVEEFFSATSFEVFGVFVTAHEVLTFVIALAVAIALYVLLNRTRTGVAMRAIVDNRELLALQGARPGLLGMLSWALGSSLAALAGILLINELGLDYFQLTLLVVNAYAAAMLGKLVNLPRTFIGALILGLLTQYSLLIQQQGLPQAFVERFEGVLGGFRAALPTVFLFAIMILLPQEKLRVGTVQGATLVKVPTWRRAVTWGVVLITAVVVITQFAGAANTANLGNSLSLALIMLSLVVLTGYGGDVSLGQMTFVGFGALVVARTFGGNLNLGTLLAAGLVAAITGAIIAIPALRLRGLYLGLATLAFAVAMDKLVFETSELGFSLGGAAEVQRPTVLGISLASEAAMTVAVAVAFVLLAFFTLWIRRGRYGRFLLATRDSPAACGTLGLNITGTRVAVFAISAGMAGVAGAMFSGMRVSVGAADFTMFQSLPVLLLAVVGGITSITGALIGGMALGWLPVLQDRFPAVGGLAALLIGVAAILLGRNPNGIAGWLFKTAKGGTVDEDGDEPRPASLEPADDDTLVLGEVTPVG
ncbi:MAG: ABC transporter permease [Actinobacteria bacterium]|nr:ABC transporter permease [Actinomycetota bacterium]